MHVDNLSSILIKTDSGGVEGKLDERLQAFAKGEISHASEAFSSLWRILTQNEDTTGETACEADPSPVRPPPVWGWAWGLRPLETALIKSIQRGSLCDRRYLAKRDNSGKSRAPIYISSIVLGATESTLNTRKLLFIHEHPHRTQMFHSNQGSEEERRRVLGGRM